MLSVPVDGEAQDDPMPAHPRYRVMIRSLITVQTGDTERQYAVSHEVTRYVDGAWSVKANRRGIETTMSGDGQVPALVDADGSVIVFFPLGEPGD